MTEAGFFEQPTRVNRTGLAIVILMHGAAITALALSKMETPIVEEFIPTKIWNVEERQPPEPNPEPKAEPQPQQQQRATLPEPEVETSTQQTNVLDAEPARLDEPLTFDVEPLPQPRAQPIDPPREPVRMAAAIDPRSVMQPDYPASEQRSGGEGVVVIRVLIGADGRVKAVEKVKATSDAFYRATERHALRQWRFRPATLDGRPVESWKELTVRFELTGQA